MKFCTVFMLQMNVRLQWVKRVRKVNTSNTEPINTQNISSYSKHGHLSRGFRPSSLLLLAQGTVCCDILTFGLFARNKPILALYISSATPITSFLRKHIFPVFCMRLLTALCRFSSELCCLIL